MGGGSVYFADTSNFPGVALTKLRGLIYIRLSLLCFRDLVMVVRQGQMITVDNIIRHTLLH